MCSVFRCGRATTSNGTDYDYENGSSSPDSFGSDNNSSYSEEHSTRTQDDCRSERNECDRIAPGEVKYGLRNDGESARRSCGCEREYRKCLRDTGSRRNCISSMALRVRNQCYSEEYPIVGCDNRWFLCFNFTKTIFIDTGSFLDFPYLTWASLDAVNTNMIHQNRGLINGLTCHPTRTNTKFNRTAFKPGFFWNIAKKTTKRSARNKINHI